MGRSVRVALFWTLAGCGLDLTGTQPNPPTDDPSAHPAADAGPPGTLERVDAEVPGDAGAGAPESGAPESGVGTLPRSCADLGAPGAGPYTLYLDGDPNKPWSARCANGFSYLVLPAPDKNVSAYPAGGCATGSVTTKWSMVRFDPATRTVDTSDFAGATSTGSAAEVSGNGSYRHTYTQIPYGAARTCRDEAESASAHIDLTGTHFAIDSSTNWRTQGWSNERGNTPFGQADVQGATARVSVGGYPAGISCADDYYTTTGGACLKLVYTP